MHGARGVKSKTMLSYSDVWQRVVEAVSGDRDLENSDDRRSASDRPFARWEALKRKKRASEVMLF
jgi:hypothetical protein